MPFGLFRKKKSRPKTPVLPIVAKMTNAKLVDFVTKSLAELTEPRMQSCALIGYDHMRTLGPVLAREIPHSPDNADKWDQIADHIFALLQKVYTEPDSTNSEAHKRRLGYFLRGTCLRALETRSIRDPALLNDLAAIWIGLVPGGRALRSAINSWPLWTDDETALFAEVTDEESGERYFLTHLVSHRVRDSAAFVEWLEKDLPDDIKDELRRMERGDDGNA